MCQLTALIFPCLNRLHLKKYSHKLKAADLRYGIAISIKTGNIVWASGPYKCAEFNGNSIFEEHLLCMLDSNKLVITDNGYKKQEMFYSWYGDDKYKRLHSLIRARHICVNGKLKSFRVLTKKFRQNLHFHAFCFLAIVHVRKLEIDRSPLFDLRV